MMIVMKGSCHPTVTECAQVSSTTAPEATSTGYARPNLLGMLAVAALFLAVSIWAYLPTILAMASKWWNDPQYSQGYLVPVFSLLVLYLRRNKVKDAQPVVDIRGLLLIIPGLAAHVVSGYFNMDWVDGMSILPVLAGLFWLLGGLPYLYWSWPAILFLVFMVPLPYSVETGLGYPLQRIATLGSVFLLQTSGFPAVAEGNIIYLSQSRIGVVEACSGLSMLLIFFALSTAMVILYQPPWLDRIVLIVSAIPIAILVNVVRITITGMAQEWFGEEIAQKIFHDWAGWLMMPAALGLLVLEMRLLRKLAPMKEVKPRSHVGSASIKEMHRRQLGRK